MERTGLTKEQEEALFAPSPEWYAEWAQFLEEGAFNAAQLQVLKGFQMQSYQGYRLVDEGRKINSFLNRQGNYDRIKNHYFPNGQLDRIILFSNRMAYKREAEHFYTGPIPCVERNSIEETALEVEEADAPRA